ncbi:hypothetical protein D3C78_1700960 [compost metagenome]
MLLLAVRSGQQPEVYDGGDIPQPGDYWHRGVCVGSAVAVDFENHHPFSPGSAKLSRTAKTGEQLALNVVESRAHSDGLRVHYVAA